MSVYGFEDAENAIVKAWIRYCKEQGWPFEADVADEITTFVIDIITSYIVNKYAGGYDVLELAIQDAFTNREERLGEPSWFSDIVSKYGEK